MRGKVLFSSKEWGNARSSETAEWKEHLVQCVNDKYPNLKSARRRMREVGNVCDNLLL